MQKLYPRLGAHLGDSSVNCWKFTIGPTGTSVVSSCRFGCDISAFLTYQGKNGNIIRSGPRLHRFERRVAISSSNAFPGSRLSTFHPITQISSQDQGLLPTGLTATQRLLSDISDSSTPSVPFSTAGSLPFLHHSERYRPTTGHDHAFNHLQTQVLLRV